MSRWTALSDFDYAEEAGDPVSRQRQSDDHLPAKCVQCGQRFSLLQAAEHRRQTDHQISYKGRIVKLGID